MGKKSKKKHARKGTPETAAPTSSPLPSSPNNLPDDGNFCYPAPPQGVSCWICLEEEPDEKGQPLVRDCSCRGDSGFSHVSCIVKYAEAKTKAELGKSIEKLRIWTHCHCCHQNYQGQLSLDMANHMVDYCEENYPGNQIMNQFICAQALSQKMLVIGNMKLLSHSTKLSKEGEATGLQVIFMIEQLQEVHNSAIPMDLLKIKANAYCCLGKTLSLRGTKDRAMKCFEQCRDTCKAIGNEYGVREAEKLISDENPTDITPMDVFFLRETYKDKIKEFGEGSPDAIVSGTRLALGLHAKNYPIEAERLLDKIVVTSRRFHGMDHQYTKFAESFIPKITERRVYLASDIESTSICYLFLGYTDTSKGSCTLQGPFSAEGEISTNMTITAEAKDVIPGPGTPVICHGLKNAKRLNGKVGEVRNLDPESLRYEVHFEEQCLKPCLVKAGNVHILLSVIKER